MDLLIDTCVLPRCKLETARIYREQFGLKIGFELLPMFDLMPFEENLKDNLELFAEGTLFFHEPVWGVEHTGPRGSIEYKESMYHISKRSTPGLLSSRCETAQNGWHVCIVTGF